MLNIPLPMVRALAIFLFSTLPGMLCAQENEKKKAAQKKPSEFKVIKLNEPEVYLGKYGHNAEALKSELLKIDSVQIKHCFNLRSIYRVNRFRFAVVTNGQYKAVIVQGCRLNQEIKKLIEEANPGDKIRIGRVQGTKKEKRDSSRKNFEEISIKVLDDADTSLITYKLKNKIPEPGIFSIKSQLPSKVTRLDLMFVDQLFVRCDCQIPALCTEFKVMAFDLKAYHNGSRMTYSSTGSDLTNEMRDALVHAHTGTKFHIEKIQVKTADGVVGYLRPRTFKVIP